MVSVGTSLFLFGTEYPALIALTAGLTTLGLAHLTMS